MKIRPLWLCGFVLVTLPFVAQGGSAGEKPEEVITRLMDNAGKKPPGPVEDDVTGQSIKTAAALKAGMNEPDPVRNMIAAPFQDFSLASPLTAMYSNGPAALYFGEVKLTAQGIADHQDDSTPEQENPPGFGASGGFCDFIGPRMKAGGRVIATFCLVRQHGAWKVHGVYLSNDVIAGANRDFIIKELSAFAGKQ